jgi:hypothetical protein
MLALATIKQRIGEFLSYARNDGVEVATKLRPRLHEHAPDIQGKQDSPTVGVVQFLGKDGA